MKYPYWAQPIAVEFSRFRVLPGKTERVDEWMKYLRDHLPECLVSLEGEKMYVETIFREKTPQGEEFLCWYSIQGEGGVRVDQSPHEIDRVRSVASISRPAPAPAYPKSK